MKQLRVNIPGREYDINIGRNILDISGSIIKELASPSLIAVITDSNVEPLYCSRLISSLDKEGFQSVSITIPAGESSKSIDMLNFLYARLLNAKITRTDLIIALGGGVVGDLAGFCAATLLRGIPFIQIPTTLLAQVDSSVGGKVAVNLPRGKNLAGAFYQPKAVIIDPCCLETLSDRIFSDGMAEVIKYGAILDEALFEKLESAANRSGIMDCIEDVIYRCCDLKRMVVENDETDTGMRMILNFGHTFGHAIEKKYNFEKYTHGEAVAAGMLMAAELSERYGIAEEGTAKRIQKIIKGYGLPDRIDLDKKSLIDAVSVDKKGDGNIINLILPKKIGKVIIKQIEKRNI